MNEEALKSDCDVKETTYFSYIHWKL